MYPSHFSFFSFHRGEYFEIIDGNGITVFSRYGYSSVKQRTFKEVSFGNSGIINVQIYLRQSRSKFTLKFGILKQGLQFGELVSKLKLLFALSFFFCFFFFFWRGKHTSLYFPGCCAKTIKELKQQRFGATHDNGKQAFILFYSAFTSSNLNG